MNLPFGDGWNPPHLRWMWGCVFWGLVHYYIHFGNDMGTWNDAIYKLYIYIYIDLKCVRILCIYHVEMLCHNRTWQLQNHQNHRKSSSNAVLEVERRYNLKASESELFRLLVPGVKSMFVGAGLLVHVLLGNDFWCSGWEGLNEWYHASRHVAGGNGWLVALVFRNREQPDAF